MTQMGSILRNAREAKGLTQASLAEQIDVSIRTIVAIENNQRNPTYDVLFRLVRTLGISADQIFYPDAATLTTEQDQLIRELLACDKRAQKIIMPTLQSLVRAIRHDEETQQNM
jgi:transcriptional regulator with XRE-family HTH domain